ncbi:MAG: hypothetical protein IJ192_11935 [Clostridia bacterium]|nr:hypothetical protein [Clostridia bacterium]
MMTNKKLLEEITARAQNDSQVLCEQLRAQQVEMKTAQAEFTQQMENTMRELHQQLGIELYRQITDSNKSHIDKLNEEYTDKLNQVKKELEEKMNTQFSNIVHMNNVLFDSITSVQKDTAVIMETLQLILTNMLIDGVSHK